MIFSRFNKTYNFFWKSKNELTLLVSGYSLLHTFIAYEKKKNNFAGKFSFDAIFVRVVTDKRHWKVRYDLILAAKFSNPSAIF